VISTLVLHYSGKDSAAAVFVAGLAGALFAILKPEIVDAKMLSTLQTGAGLLGVGSKIPQILAIWQEGGTGQLSAFAVCFSNLNRWGIGTDPSGDYRSSTISQARFRASSLPCRRSMTHRFSMVSSLASLSIWYSLRRCCTTGTRPRARSMCLKERLLVSKACLSLRRARLHRAKVPPRADVVRLY
jgi:hypothetical protein